MRKHILQITIFSIVIFIFVLFVFHYIYMKPYKTMSSSDGFFDLSDYELDSDFVVSLEGNWDYKGLIDDDKIKILPDAISYNLEETIYSARIHVPTGNNFYCLFIPRICADYKIVINGEVIFANGYYNNSASYINFANTYSFYTENDTLDIELYTRALPALPYKSLPIVIGTPATTNILFLKLMSVDTLLLVIMILSGIYYLVLSLFEKSQKNYKLFSIICFIMAFRCSINNLVFLGLQKPNIPYGFVATAIPTLTPLLLIAILFYTNTLYANCFNRIAFWIDIVMCSSYIVLAPFLNYTYPNEFLIPYILVHIYTTTLLFVAGIKLAKNHSTFASAFIISSMVMLIAIVMESTMSLTNYKMGHALNIGFIFYIILQTNTFLVTLRNTYTREKELSKSYDKILATARTEKTNFISSHLKPHFIFNALNAIAGYALFEPETAKKICSSLIVYNKQMFEHNNLIETNTLENEINLAKAFGYIESERFPNITIEYDIDDNLGDTIVPSLLIQPLLENAINHGIRKRPAKIPGHIEISIHNINNLVHFVIKDDGVGMDEETLHNVLQAPTDDKYHGLFHLSLRLGELFYEELNVESETDKGTTISFKIPR